MSMIGLVSYGLCTLAFTFLTALIMASWRGGLPGALLASACLLTAAWAGVLTWASWNPQVPAIWPELLELARTLSWLVFLVWLIAPLRGSHNWPRILSLVSVGGPGAAMLVVAWQRLAAPGELAPVAAGTLAVFAVVALGLALLGLVLVEQVYRNLPPDHRWANRFLCLGLTVIFGYDLFLHANTLLYAHVVASTWEARGVVQALAVPLIAVAATRNRDWALPVFISRHVAFHTVAVLGVSLYLLVIAVGGYYIRDFGGSWGEFLQIVLVVAAVVGLILLLGSRDVRARLRVFLSKHFFSNKYDYREEWLLATQRLAAEDDGKTPHVRAVQVIADIFDSPAGAVWSYRDDSGYLPVGDWNLGISADAAIGEDDPLIHFLSHSRWVIDMAEYRDTPSRYGDLTLPPTLTAIKDLWAIVPLLQRQRLTGFLVLTRPTVDNDITWEDRDLLNTLGRQVASYLAQHENAQALSQARQFEAFNQLTAFLMHDLKNLIAQQSLVLKNAEKHKQNPAFVDDMLVTIGNSVKRMERLLGHLQQRRQRGLIERVNVHRALTDAATACADRLPNPELVLADERLVVEADPEEFTMVVTHLLRNAQDATPEDGRIVLSSRWDGRRLTVEISDTGCGMSAEFIRDELFRPFRTTKSAKGMGIGAYQAREFVHHAGGRVTVDSRPGEGTRFRFTLPASAAERAEGIGNDTMTGLSGGS